MGITITKKGAKCPEGCKLSNKITSYLFEQEYGELRNMSKSEIEKIREAAKILFR